MTNNAIIVDSVWKKFRIYHERNQYLKSTITQGRRAQYEDFWALKDVSFEVPVGQTFGIIGANGSGKSTLLKCLAGILTPEKGILQSNGRTAALLELGAGFHPDLSGRENVSLNGAILGMTRREIEKKFEDIVSFAGLEQFIDTPVKNYSSGMVVRLGFAVAINVEPEILIIDEVLAVGDEEFQQRCFQKIEEFRRDGRTIIFVSHGLGQVSQLCEKALWLDKGTVRTIDDSYKVVSEYTGESHQIHTPLPVHIDTEPEIVEVDEEVTPDKNRWGSGEVRVDSVTLLNSSGIETLNIDSGESVEIKINYSIHSPVKELVVGLRISHLHGITMWGTNTKRSNHIVEQNGSNGSVRFQIPEFPLLEGTFDMTVAISDRSEVSPYDHRENFVRFNVRQTKTFDEGAVRFKGKWSN
jgi:ABC-type polysaccharide/polyol phosphate transport system ATPase subunit